MHIVLLDDSIPYRGDSPTTQPMGGPEKAIASLAPELAKRGHDVSVVNRCEAPAMMDGVAWVPWESPRPPEPDVVIVLRKPALLKEFPDAPRTFLWMATPGQILNKPKNQELLERYRPFVTFMGDYHFRTWAAWKDFPKAQVMPGVRAEYLIEEDCEPVEPPTAIVTTNPLNGLDWLLEIWVEKIRPKVDGARLRIFSAGLARGKAGAEVPEALKAILAKTLEAEDHGVMIERPGSDLDMAEAYRTARAHLYPGTENEVYCSTLAESQAMGLPAVARPVGAVPERVRNGQTGFLAPDDDAFGNVAIHLMTSEAAWKNMSRDCRLIQRTRPWNVVAAEFEALF